MKTKFIKILLTQFVCWVLLMQMINISVDPPDQSNFVIATSTHTEDVSVNEIESIYELILDGVFDIAVPESEEQDTDNYVEIFEFYCLSLNDNTIAIPEYPLQHNRYFQNDFVNHFPQLNSPPPKIV